MKFQAIKILGERLIHLPSNIILRPPKLHEEDPTLNPDLIVLQPRNTKVARFITRTSAWSPIQDFAHDVAPLLTDRWQEDLGLNAQDARELGDRLEKAANSNRIHDWARQHHGAWHHQDPNPTPHSVGPHWKIPGELATHTFEPQHILEFATFLQQSQGFDNPPKPQTDQE